MSHAKEMSSRLRESLHYHSFGMPMPGRSLSLSNYRFGFNGQEKDDEVNGFGNSISFKYRILDPRLGRFLSVDPLANTYAFNSPYSFAENKLGLGKELEGLELITPLFSSSGAWQLSRPVIETVTKVDVEIRLPKVPPINLPPIVITETIPRGAPVIPTPETFDPSQAAVPDATSTSQSPAPAKPMFEARRKPATEAEQDAANENQKIDALKRALEKKNVGKTKENTKGQEKETGQQQEEIESTQRTNRNQGKPNKIESTKKSEQKTANELKKLKNNHNN